MDVTSKRASTTDADRAVQSRRGLAVRLHRRERRLFLALVDLLAINGALLLYLILRPDRDRLGLPIDSVPGLDLLWQRPHWFLIASVLWLVIAQAFDAYSPQTANAFGRSSAAALRAGTIWLLAYLLIPYWTPTLPPSRSAWLWLVGSTWLLLALGRLLYVAVLGHQRFRRPTVIVGAGWAGQTIAQVLLQHDDGTLRIVGYVDDDPELVGQRVLPRDSGGASVTSIDPQAFTVLGVGADLKKIITKHRVSTLVLAITNELDPKMFRVLTDCLELRVEIVPMTRLYERLTGRVPVEYVGGDWHLAMPLEHPGTTTLAPTLKRAFDIVSASFGLLLLAPLAPFIAAAIWIESPGPIFYTQERIGRGGRVFRVYKFRSMRPNAEEGMAVWSQHGDPRITRIGRLLRATHLDEFPQFLNILRGEMSAVGPRPERPEFLAELIQDIPFYSVRHAVKPGMAGWALVNCGYGSSKEDALRKLQYDLYYIKNQSLLLDIVILLKTVLRSIGLQGR